LSQATASVVPTEPAKSTGLECLRDNSFRGTNRRERSLQADEICANIEGAFAAGPWKWIFMAPA